MMPDYKDDFDEEYFSGVQTIRDARDTLSLDKCDGKQCLGLHLFKGGNESLADWGFEPEKVIIVSKMDKIDFRDFT